MRFPPALIKFIIEQVEKCEFKSCDPQRSNIFTDEC